MKTRAALVVLALCASGLTGCSNGGGDDKTGGGSAAPATPAVPTMSLGANNTSLVAGESLRLTWTSTAAEGCTATGDWGGAFASNGSITLLPPAGSYRYAMTCTGAGGSATSSVNVVVNSAPPGGPGTPGPVGPVPAPVVTLSATLVDVITGTPVTLNWSASNADACTASGGWSGAFAASGSTVVVPPEGSNTYRLLCSGTGGNGNAEVTVLARPVVPPEPDAALAEFNRVKDLEEGCCNATQ